MHILAAEVSSFNELTVYETSEFYGRTGKYRCLKFKDDDIQGAIDLKDPQRVLLDYQRAMIDLMEIVHPDFRNAFLIGHGIGTIAGHYPGKEFKVAEIDGKVVELSRKFFGYLQDNVVVGDGRLILGGERPNRYDFILLDAFTEKGTPLHLLTIDFFAMTLEKLGPGGVIMMNVMGKPKNDRFLNAIVTTLSESYPFTKAISLRVERDADARNIILVGSRQPIDIHARDLDGLYEVEFDSGHIIRDYDYLSQPPG